MHIAIAAVQAKNIRPEAPASGRIRCCKYVSFSPVSRHTAGQTGAGLPYHLLERVLSLHNDIHSAGQRAQTVAAILRSRMPLGALSSLAPLSDMIQQLSQQKVIWAILPTNMGHITHPPPTPPRGRGAERLYHKAYKAYKAYKTYKS